MKFKKVYTWKQILLDPRINPEMCIKNYDGYGKHHVECIEGFKFENERTIDIGTVSEICDSINNNLEKQNI